MNYKSHMEGLPYLTVTLIWMTTLPASSVVWDSTLQNVREC